MGKLVLGTGSAAIRSAQRNSPAVKHATNYPGGSMSTVRKVPTSTSGSAVKGTPVGTPFGKSGVTGKTVSNG